MITNDAGEVAIKYYQTVPHTVKVAGQEYYAFVVRANICLAWIRPEHVAMVLSIRRKKCCGNGAKPNEYRYANESDVRRWTNGGGR